MHKIFRCIHFIWLASVFALAAPAAYADSQKEAQVKAATIYRFSHFIQWPPPKNLEKSAQGTVNICVIGTQYAEDMRSIFDKASSKGSRTYKLLSQWNSIGADCHILFIGESEKSRLGSILGDLQKQPVLTVSDIKGFADMGGIIEFSLIDNKLKVGVVNIPAADQAGVHVGAELLEVALSVKK